MGILGGWTPLSGPKVEAEASSRPSALAFPLRGIFPSPPIPSTSDDGFTRDSCCAPNRCGSGGGTCGDMLAVNVGSGALLYRYKIPENTIPIELSYESDQSGEASMGGNGWRSNYHRKITRSGSVVTVVCGDGCQVSYNQDPTATYTFYPSSGIDNIVAQNPFVTQLYTETLPSGLAYRYDLANSGRLVNIIDPDGRTWTLGYPVGTTLSYVENHRSRRVTLSYASGGTLVAAFLDTAARRTTLSYDASGRIAYLTGPQGCVTTFQYEGSTQRLTQISDADNYYSLISYALTKVKTVTAADPHLAANDQVTTYTYLTQIGKVDNPLGNVITYSMDSSKRISKIQDAEGNITSFTWDGSARVTTMVNPKGVTTKYRWEAVTTAVADTRKRLQAVDPASLSYYTTFTYTGQNYELQSVIDPLTHRTTFTYLLRHLQSVKNAKGELTTWNYSSNVLSSIQDALGYFTTFTFGSNGMVSSVRDAESNVTTYAYDTAANVSQLTDALGNSTYYTYDAANRMASATDAEGNPTTYVYTGCGLVQSVTNPLGFTTQYQYDQNRQQTVTIDALGNRTSYTYDKGRDPSSLTNARGKITTFTYDRAGRRTQLKDALGQTHYYSYDANGNQTSTTDPGSVTTTYVYDTLDRLQVTIDPLGYRTTNTYDKANNRTAVKDARSNSTTFTLDELNRAVATKRADGGLSTTVFDAVGKVQATVDALGNRTTFTYDKTRHLREVLDPLGNRTTTVYNAIYNRTASINARGAIIGFTYDRARRLTRIQDVTGYYTTYSYDAAGNRTGSVDPNLSAWTFVYDGVNRRIVSINPLSERTTTTYDAVSNRTGIQYPNLERVTWSYDALNRLEVQTNPAGYFVTYVYNDATHTRSVIDFNANRATQTFDARGALVTRRSAENIVTTLGYDEVGNLRFFEDGLGHRTSYSYSSVNYRTETQDPLNSRTTYTYDQVGNALTRRDPDGNITTYTYDARNQTTRIDYPGSFVTLVYDEVGNLTAWRDPVPLYFSERTYDLRNAILSVKREDGLRLTYTYNKVGLRATLEDDTAGLQTYIYDAARRLQLTTNPKGETTTFGYDGRGRLRHIEYANNTDATYTYDATGGVNTIETFLRQPMSSFATQDYALDKGGRVTGETYTQGATTGILTYTFDKDYRLTNEMRSGDFTFDITYAYDAGGNRTTMVSDGATTTYAYNARNNLTSLKDGSGFSTYQYDNRGNRTLLLQGASRTTYVYDEESRLITLQDGSGQRSFKYNAFGERVGWTNLGTLITEMWDQGTVLARIIPGPNRTRYTYAPSTVRKFIGQGSTNCIYVFNSYGTLNATYVGAGSPGVSERFEATYFGKVINSISDADAVLKFKGARFWVTDASGLLLVPGGGFYDPVLGRRIQMNGPSVLYTRRVARARDVDRAMNPFDVNVGHTEPMSPEEFEQGYPYAGACKTCNECLDEAWDNEEIQDLWDEAHANNCSADVCCVEEGGCSSEIAEPPRFGATTSVNPDTKVAHISIGSVQCDCAGLVAILLHELQHAVDFCASGSEPSSYNRDTAVYWEARACQSEMGSDTSCEDPGKVCQCAMDSVRYAFPGESEEWYDLQEASCERWVGTGGQGLPGMTEPPVSPLEGCSR